MIENKSTTNNVDKTRTNNNSFCTQSISIGGNVASGSNIGLLNLNDLIQPQTIVLVSLAELQGIQSAYYIWAKNEKSEVSERSHSFMNHREPQMRERRRGLTRRIAGRLSIIGLGDGADLVVGIDSGLGDDGISITSSFGHLGRWEGSFKVHEELIFVNGLVSVGGDDGVKEREKTPRAFEEE